MRRIHPWAKYVALLSASFCGGAASHLLMTEIPRAEAQAGRDETLRVDAVRTQRLEIVDRLGQKRAGISIIPGEVVGLMLYNPEGEPAVALTGGKLGGQAAVYDARSVPAVVSRVEKDGSRRFYLADGRGKDAISLDVRRDGDRQLAFATPDGAQRMDLGVSPAGAATMSLRDARGMIHAGLGVSAKGKPGLAMTGGDGAAELLLGESTGGLVGLLVSHAKKTGGVFAARQDGQVGLLVHDAAGVTQWKAP